jgi:hypothetical protein
VSVAVRLDSQRDPSPVRAKKLDVRCIRAGISAVDRHVLDGLRRWEDHESLDAFPSQEFISLVTGHPRETVCRSLKRLSETGLVTKQPRPDSSALLYVTVDTSNDPNPNPILADLLRQRLNEKPHRGKGRLWRKKSAVNQGCGDWESQGVVTGNHPRYSGEVSNPKPLSQAGNAELEPGRPVGLSPTAPTGAFQPVIGIPENVQPAPHTLAVEPEPAPAPEQPAVIQAVEPAPNIVTEPREEPSARPEPERVTEPESGREESIRVKTVRRAEASLRATEKHAVIEAKAQSQAPKRDQVLEICHALHDAVTDRFPLIELRDIAPSHRKNISSHLRRYPETSLWSALTAFLAAGGYSFPISLGIDWLASNRLIDAMTKARDWDSKGRAAIVQTRGAKPYVGPAPVSDGSHGGSDRKTPSKLPGSAYDSVAPHEQPNHRKHGTGELAERNARWSKEAHKPKGTLEFFRACQALLQPPAPAGSAR